MSEGLPTGGEVPQRQLIYQTSSQKNPSHKAENLELTEQPQTAQQLEEYIAQVTQFVLILFQILSESLCSLVFLRGTLSSLYWGGRCLMNQVSYRDFLKLFNYFFT